MMRQNEDVEQVEENEKKLEEVREKNITEKNIVVTRDICGRDEKFVRSYSGKI